MPPKIMFSAAEVSADVHASYLAKELKGCILFGMGGEKMKAAGVDIRIDITSKSSVGIIEALKHIPSHLSTIGKLKKMLAAEKPDALILIDAQGLNMILAQYAKKIGIKTIYYIAPQEWLWGTQKGLKKVADTIDLIISIFKSEHDAYTLVGGNSYYIGHPILDIARTDIKKDELCKKLDISIYKKIVALCPGSRSHEINNLLPILLDVAKKIGNAEFVIPIASSKFRSVIEEQVKASGLNIKTYEGSSYDVLGNCDLAIASSGTIILECVCMKIPVIMFYKISWLTYFIAKYLMGVKLAYYSMPNILTNKMIVPEFVMDRAKASIIYVKAVQLLKDPSSEVNGYQEVLSNLGRSGAVKEYAKKILEFIGAR